MYVMGDNTGTLRVLVNTSKVTHISIGGTHDSETQQSFL